MRNDQPLQSFQPNLNVILQCPDCREVPPNLMDEHSSGDVVCGGCGLVLMDRTVDTRSEWRTFSNDEGEDPSRVGAAANPLLSVNQIDTVISEYDRGAGTAKDLKKIHAKTTTDKKMESLQNAFREIGAYCASIALPKIVSDSAMQLYRRVYDSKALHGKSSKAVIATCLFVACRQESVARTYREIATLTQVTAKEIGRCQKALEKALNTQAVSTHPADLIPRFCSHLQLPAYVQKPTIDLIGTASKLGTLAGKSHLSVAAACIYFVCFLFQVPKHPKDVATVARITRTTLRSSYKLLYQERENLIDLDALRAAPHGEHLSFDDLALP